MDHEWKNISPIGWMFISLMSPFVLVISLLILCQIIIEDWYRVIMWELIYKVHDKKYKWYSELGLFETRNFVHKE